MAILLFDWGGSSIKYGVWHQQTLSDTAAVKTPDSWEKMQAQLLEICHQYQQRYDIQGVAISAPGSVDPERRVIGGLSAIPYIHHFPIVEALTTLFACRSALKMMPTPQALPKQRWGPDATTDTCCL